nr:helix-turn-helix domain-containing protein [Gordonia humi]
MTVEEVASLTRQSRSILHEWAQAAEHGAAAKGPVHYNLGRRRYWRRSDVEKWLESRRVEVPGRHG